MGNSAAYNVNRSRLSTSPRAAAERYARLLAFLGRDRGPRKQPQPRTIAALCRWYCDLIQPARGNREHTIAANRVIFARMAQFLETQGVTGPDSLVARITGHASDAIRAYRRLRRTAQTPENVTSRPGSRRPGGGKFFQRTPK